MGRRVVWGKIALQAKPFGFVFSIIMLCYVQLVGRKAKHFYRDYRVVVTAGKDAGIGVDALPLVLRAMGNLMETKPE